MITDNYKNDLKKLHKSKAFGNRSKIPAEVTRCIEEYNIRSILDFGCGKGNVVAALKETYPNLKVYGWHYVFASFPAPQYEKCIV